MKDDDNEDKVRKLLAASVPKKDNVHQLFPDKKPKMSIVGNENLQSAGGQAPGDMSIIGNKNTQVAGDMIQHHHHRPARLTIAPPQDSIGADTLLKNGIMARFNELGERREKRFGKRAYSVMNSNFKKAFDIHKDTKWTIIWTWPVVCAPAIIQYLDDKLANTIQGRIEGAVKKGDYIHTRPHLYKLEKEALEHLNLDKDFVENSLQMLFRASSHKDLTHLQQWQWVCHLEALVNQQYEE